MIETHSGRVNCIPTSDPAWLNRRNLLLANQSAPRLRFDQSFATICAFTVEASSGDQKVEEFLVLVPIDNLL